MRLTVLVAAVALVVMAAGSMPARGRVAARNAASAEVFVMAVIVGGRLAARPGTLALSVHGSLWLHKLHWTAWGGAVAKATARARVHGCVPDCTLGKIEYLPARVRLSEVVSCGGRRVYGRLGYRLRGEVPRGVDRGGRIDLRPTGC